MELFPNFSNIFLSWDTKSYDKLKYQNVNSINAGEHQSNFKTAFEHKKFSFSVSFFFWRKLDVFWHKIIIKSVDGLIYGFLKCPSNKYFKAFSKYNTIYRAQFSKICFGHIQLILKLVFFAEISRTTWAMKKLFASICILVWRAFRWKKQFLKSGHKISWYKIQQTHLALLEEVVWQFLSWKLVCM